MLGYTTLLINAKRNQNQKANTFESVVNTRKANDCFALEEVPNKSNQIFSLMAGIGHSSCSMCLNMNIL